MQLTTNPSLILNTPGENDWWYQGARAPMDPPGPDRTWRDTRRVVVTMVRARTGPGSWVVLAGHVW